MLERVATAICKSRTCEGAHCCQWPANGARLSDCPVQRGQYDDAAHDAIAAMREPPYSLVSAGKAADLAIDRRFAETETPPLRSDRVREIWQAMLDEALVN